MAGAACDAGKSLTEVKSVTEKARNFTTSIGIATHPGQLPGLDKPIFELGENEIEYGMGIHGEPGIRRTKMKTADQLTETLYQNLMTESEISRGDQVCVLMNSL